MGKIISINPATEEKLNEFKELSDSVINKKLDLSVHVFEEWKKTSFKKRSEMMKNLARLMNENSKRLGELATLEMGKTITEAIAEVKKCALVCDYYAENAEIHLAPVIKNTEAQESFYQFDPLGTILAVMPWNFPFWQVFRFLAPVLMAGNVAILKHASNVPACALAIEEMTLLAGFPKGVFQTLLIGSSKVENIINDQRVKAVALTGSELAGSKVAEAAGRNIKKSVLELGGSDAFIVRKDANLKEAVIGATVGRLQNNGQSCIAAKRFIVHKEISESFINDLKKQFEQQIVGNPNNKDTTLGPVINKESLDELLQLIDESKKMGAEIVTGGKRIKGKGFFLKPTIIKNITKKMPLYSKETFGPVASIFIVENDEEAIRIANDTEFGLGTSIWTKDIKTAKNMATKLDSGCVFINKIVSSHPNLPFGGNKKSGYGRELSELGIREFVNIKTVYIK